MRGDDVNQFHGARRPQRHPEIAYAILDAQGLLGEG
ncbi:hypothetical protein B551_0219255 [Cupriavidus sp. HPC(L)]|nr:hypothetical protein B551_0219255 [Cupriavidus sp. HPC(L)]